jgi:hypothetical protein
MMRGFGFLGVRILEWVGVGDRWQDFCFGNELGLK